MSKSFNKVRQYFRELNRLETGFSMLEAVVVVGVLLALAVSGFIAYGAITDNAKTAGVKSAASEVHTGVVSASIDGDSGTQPQDVIDNWNASTKQIKVEIIPPTAGETSLNGDFCVQATNVDSPDITAREGNCSDVASGSDPGAGNGGNTGSKPDIPAGAIYVDSITSDSASFDFFGYGLVTDTTATQGWGTPESYDDGDWWYSNNGATIELAYRDPDSGKYVEFFSGSEDYSNTSGIDTSVVEKDGHYWTQVHVPPAASDDEKAGFQKLLKNGGYLKFPSRGAGRSTSATVILAPATKTASEPVPYSPTWPAPQ